MKTAFKNIKHWLMPPFLKRLDGYLLDHYPDVWRTRGHYVLFYTLTAIVLLFLLGMAYPVSVNDLLVDPIMPIRLVEEAEYYYPSATLVFVVILFWINNQFQLKNGASNWKDTLRILLVYCICFFFLVGCVSIAFRMGTIVRTSYGLMDQKDMNYLKENDFFVYGFLPMDGDTSLNFTSDDYREREAEFEKIWRNEETLLQNRYNIPYLLTLYDSLLETLDTAIVSSKKLQYYRPSLTDLSGLGQLSYHSYTTCMPFLRSRSYSSIMYDATYLSILLELSEKKEFSHIRQITFLSDLAYLKDKPDKSDKKKFIIYSLFWRRYFHESFRSNFLHLSSLSNLSNLPTRSFTLAESGKKYYNRLDEDLSSLLHYNDYYLAKTPEKLFHNLLNKYELNFSNAIKIDKLKNKYFTFPIAPLQLEHCVRSVQHARQFLSEWIIYRFWKKYVFPMLPLLAFILFMVRYFSFQGLSVALILYVLSSLVFNVLWGDKDGMELNTLFDKAHLFLLLVMPIMVGVSLLKKKQFWHTNLGYILTLFMLTALTMFMLIPQRKLMGEETTMYVAYTVGLVMVLMMPSVEALPKGE